MNKEKFIVETKVLTEIYIRTDDLKDPISILNRVEQKIQELLSLGTLYGDPLHVEVRGGIPVEQKSK